MRELGAGFHTYTARREEVEIAFAFETELFPCLAAVAAAQEPERIDEP